MRSQASTRMDGLASEQGIIADDEPSGDSGSYMGSSIRQAGAGVVPGIRPIALVGHRYKCPVPGHESSVIITGSETSEVMGRPVARIGDKTSCGALIITGSKNAHIDGKRPIARKGDRGIHPELNIEGEIIEGLEMWTLE